jgi:hypothetical protein
MAASVPMLVSRWGLLWGLGQLESCGELCSETCGRALVVAPAGNGWSGPAVQSVLTLIMHFILASKGPRGKGKTR